MFLLILILLPLAVNANHDVGYPMNCSQQISLQTCQLLGPTDWYLAFDSTTEKSTILQPLAASIFEKNLRKLRFDTRSGHRLSIFAAYSGGVALLENICRQSADLSKLNLAAWRPIFQLKKTGFFKTLRILTFGNNKRCANRIKLETRRKQMFIYGYKPEKRAEDDFLKRWREEFRERSIQIYIIYYGESYQKDNIYEKWLKNDLINGCFFYLPQSKLKMDHTAAQLIN
uniref:Uncharacterized protein n=1 Tax=Romanomermis culicivorax TaxID=13658 RepID=A0A915IUS8_ROMCU